MFFPNNPTLWMLELLKGNLVSPRHLPKIQQNQAPNKTLVQSVMYKLTTNLFNIHVKFCQFHDLKLTHSVNTIINSKFESNQILNKLFKSGKIGEARELFDKMLDKDEYSWNTMIGGYANSGRLIEAKQLFYLFQCKNSTTWSSLIAGYCRHEFDFDALNLFWQMRVEGFQPNQYALGSVLRVCSKFTLLLGGEQIHCYGMKTGFDVNIFVVTALIDMYAKCRCIGDAENLFVTIRDAINSTNYVLWTSMLTGYSQNGFGYRAIDCFREIRCKGIEANQFTFPSVLTACSLVTAHGFGLQVHGCILRSGFEANVFVKSALVDMYAKCGDFYSARKMLQLMEVNDVIAWNSMIVGCVKHGFHKEVVSMFKTMHSRNMKIDDYTYPSALNSLATICDIKTAKSVHSLVVKTGFEAFMPVSNALIDIYAKNGNPHEALEVFNSMPNKDVISWTSLVTGYAHNNSYEEALKLFRDMRKLGVSPDQFVIASILSACAELTVLKFGQQIHTILLKLWLHPSLSVDNSLVTMYAKCGCIEDATNVFNSMQARDVVTWTALIIGYAQNGKGNESVSFYNEMIKSGTKPDYVTFVGLLFACSHTGLVKDGQSFFESMYKVYGIKPGLGHYACMIDLLGRSGKLDEAEKLINNMGFEPDSTIWKSLLSSCRVHKNIELAERAAKSLFILEPTNAVPYVLLYNIYSSSGKWESAARIRTLMKQKGLKKEPGISWIEMSGEVHKFMSEDRNHPLAAKIFTKVDVIMVLIKKLGYVPDTSFALQDMGVEGKELGLSYHSEKLAIAFGLLTIPEGLPIRIFKNLRVCGDCHSAMKFISGAFHRHIILRDSKCFHHFIDGECSCRDFW